MTAAKYKAFDYNQVTS